MCSKEKTKFGRERERGGGAPSVGGRRETMKKFESLGSSVVSWMRSRGLFQQPDLTAEQVFQLEECFHIFDVDESGTVDIEEIMAAMQLLGLPAKRTVRYTHAYTHMRNCMCPI